MCGPTSNVLVTKKLEQVAPRVPLAHVGEGSHGQRPASCTEKHQKDISIRNEMVYGGKCFPIPWHHLKFKLNFGKSSRKCEIRPRGGFLLSALLSFGMGSPRDPAPIQSWPGTQVGSCVCLGLGQMLGQCPDLQRPAAEPSTMGHPINYLSLFYYL